jgi:hypothetical protein
MDLRGRTEHGFVVGLNPLRVQLGETGDVLDAGNDAPQPVAPLVGENYRLEIGDMVVLSVVSEGVWVALDVQKGGVVRTCTTRSWRSSTSGSLR